MDTLSIQTILTDSLTDLGASALVILTAVIGVAVAYYLFNFGRKLILGQTFTSWSWLDRMTYKPYKGYNRFRSRKWNLEHTMK